MRRFAVVCLVVVTAGCGGSADPCEDVVGACVPVPSGSSGEDIDRIFNDAQAGQIIAFGGGTFELSTDLQLTVDNVTLQGEGMDETVLSFAGQTTGAQGILVTGDNFNAQDLAIEDTAGDGLKLEGSDGVSLVRVRVQWNGPPSSDNGAYGLYPVQCGRVRIEASRVVGA